MSPHFTTDGYEIVPSRLSSETLHNLRLEADHLATAEKSACVRHIRAKSEVSGYGPWSQKDGSPHVQPPTELLSQMITIRLHLDDTPSENGALSVIPKSHLLGKIPSSDLATEQLKNPVTCACAEGERRVLHFEYAPQKALHPDLQWFEATT